MLCERAFICMGLVRGRRSYPWLPNQGRLHTGTTSRVCWDPASYYRIEDDRGGARHSHTSLRLKRSDVILLVGEYDGLDIQRRNTN